MKYPNYLVKSQNIFNRLRISRKCSKFIGDAVSSHGTFVMNTFCILCSVSDTILWCISPQIGRKNRKMQKSKHS